MIKGHNGVSPDMYSPECRGLLLRYHQDASSTKYIEIQEQPVHKYSGVILHWIKIPKTESGIEHLTTLSVVTSLPLSQAAE